MSLFWLQPTWDVFLKRAEEGRLAHALLLRGPAGTGKRGMAERVVEWLLCEAPGERSCGACRSCRLLAGGAHPDRFLIEPEEDKSIITVPAIRELVDRLMLTTTISRRKVALIHPAESMNVNAANALLKTLEEPPGDAVLLLVSDDPARLPVTIRSRCQSLTVNLPDREDAVRWLTAETEAERGEAELALAASGNSPLIACDALRSGEVRQFRELRDLLQRLRREPGAASACAAALGEWEDQGRLWSWVSLVSADALRASLTGRQPDWIGDATLPSAAELATLQSRADRNRRLAGTPVRSDLLLEDWLLEWARPQLAAAGLRR